MNGYQATEPFDDEAMEDAAATAEFLPGILGGIPGILGGIAPAIGGLLGGLFGGQPSPPRPPLPILPSPVPGPGVGTANLVTPGGTATLRLPEPVVTREDFLRETQGLREAINRDTARLNTTQNDLRELSQRVGVVVADTRREIDKAEKEQRAAIARVRRDISQQATTSMLMSVMMQQQLQRRLDEHTHSSHTHGGVSQGSASTTATSIGAPSTTGGDTSTTGGDNTALMFLPMMMMGSPDGASGDNNMMMMAMMMMAMGRD